MLNDNIFRICKPFFNIRLMSVMRFVFSLKVQRKIVHRPLERNKNTIRFVTQSAVVAGTRKTDETIFQISSTERYEYYRTHII